MFHYFGFVSWISSRSTGLKFPIWTENKFVPVTEPARLTGLIWRGPKWLDEKLKPLSLNQYTISDIFSFSEDLRNKSLNESDILVSYDVSSLFTNVPLDETIWILVEKALTSNWFNVTHKLYISKSDLVELLQVATKSQLFQTDKAAISKYLFNVGLTVTTVSIGQPKWTSSVQNSSEKLDTTKCFMKS